MPFDINAFKSSLRFGGAHTNLFDVRLTNPVDSSADNVIEMMVKAASLPPRTITSTPVSYFGRDIKVAGGVKNYEDWVTTIIGDEDWKIRNAIEAWSHAINSPVGNVRRLASSESSLYKSTADVIHYSKTGEVLRQYKFIGIWPVTISEVALDWSNEAIAEFQVTWSVDLWTIGDQSNTGFAGGSAA